MGRIYYLIGKSGSGKDTIYNRLLKALPKLKTFVMYTTRPMREGEINGISYYFTDEAALRKFAEEGRLIESRTYYTVKGPWIYATVDDGQIDLTNNDYLAIGTLESYDKLKRYFGNESIYPLYLEVEDGERLMRSVRRESHEAVPDYLEVCRRFLADSEDFSEDILISSGIFSRFKNDSAEECLEEIIGVIE